MLSSPSAPSTDAAGEPRAGLGSRISPRGGCRSHTELGLTPPRPGELAGLGRSKQISLLATCRLPRVGGLTRVSPALLAREGSARALVRGHQRGSNMSVPHAGSLIITFTCQGHMHAVSVITRESVQSFLPPVGRGAVSLHTNTAPQPPLHWHCHWHCPGEACGWMCHGD